MLMPLGQTKLLDKIHCWHFFHSTYVPYSIYVFGAASSAMDNQLCGCLYFGTPLTLLQLTVIIICSIYPIAPDNAFGIKIHVCFHFDYKTECTRTAWSSVPHPTGAEAMRVNCGHLRYKSQYNLQYNLQLKASSCPLLPVHNPQLAGWHSCRLDVGHAAPFKHGRECRAYTGRG